MKRDVQRVEAVVAALRKQSLDALVCAWPQHVLLLSGYWPVTAQSWVVLTKEGQVALLVPEDERGLAQAGYADQIRTFSPSSLEEIRSVREAVRKPLTGLWKGLGLSAARSVGWEDDEASVPVTYSAMHLYGAAKRALIAEAAPHATLTASSELLMDLTSRLTTQELELLRDACRVVSSAFSRGAKLLKPGLSESEAAHGFRKYLDESAETRSRRAGGFAWCMSGPNAAEAGVAFAQTGSRRLERGDFVLIHCNSYLDGYWTDVTRTFYFGEIGEREAGLYKAVLAAQAAALEVIRPGVTAAEVDHAAREVLSRNGFGKQFTHGTGHGVGFSAISSHAKPRIHPQSNDVLEAGMVFNVEPAVYLPGYGGLRQCDMVAVGPNGAEVLTTTQRSMEELVLRD